MKNKCYECVYLTGLYRYKTDSTGKGRLVNYYCKHPQGKDKGRAGYGHITMSRDGIESKIKTSPKWCPLDLDWRE